MTFSSPFLLLLFLCLAAKAQKQPGKNILVYNRDSLYLPKADLPVPPELPEAKPLPLRNEDENKIIDYVYADAAPDKKMWNNYLKKGLQPCLDSAVKKGLAAGTYTIQLKLLIGKDGRIEKAERTNDPSFGLCQCAESLLPAGPRWGPKYDRGRPVFHNGDAEDNGCRSRQNKRLKSTPTTAACVLRPSGPLPLHYTPQ